MTGRLFLSILPMALLTACEPREDRPPGQARAPAEKVAEIPPAPPAPARAPSPLPAGDRLLGKWTLVSIDGAPPPPDAYPVELTFTDGTLTARSQCISWHWRLAVEAERLRLRTPPGPVAMCARGWSDWEERFGAAMSAAERIESDGGDLIVTGLKGTLKLKRAA